MSEILNPKTRIIDTVLTLEGRKNIANNSFELAFYCFSDGNTCYRRYESEDDNLIKLTIENSNALPQDTITPEVNDSGKLKTREFMNYSGSYYPVINGNIVSSSVESNIQAGLESLVPNFFNNFKKLRIIGSPGYAYDPQETTGISNTNITFSITDQNPINIKDQISVAKIDHIESLYSDKRLSNLPNYIFLPPKNQDGTNLGEYARLEQAPYQTFDEVLAEINQQKAVGYVEECLFSQEINKLYAQFFEVSDEGVRKMDVIDFGRNNGKHVFFIGKLYRDSFGADTFVNCFCLLFE